MRAALDFLIRAMAAAEELGGTAPHRLTARIQERIAAHMARIGEESEAPLAWLRFELDPELGNRFSLRLRQWPGGKETLLAIAGPHGSPVEWMAS